jgi:SNF2 family DNA or RNA helicase
MLIKISAEETLLSLDGEEPLISKDLYEMSNNGLLDYLTENGESLTLYISKRPATLKFKFELSPEPIFTIWNRGVELVGNSLKSAQHFGYFIDGNRLVFLSENTQNYLIDIENPFALTKTLKLLKELSVKQLLLSKPDDLIACLGKYDNFHAKGEKLFLKELYPYQKEGVDWLAFCNRYGLGTILADDMGLGKTAQVIALICDTLEREPNSNILVVVPNPLLENWRREIAFFAPSIIPILHYGNNRVGLKEDLVKHQVIITPYTTMTSDISLFEDIPFRLALFDEASMLKNPNSSRTLAAKRINAQVKIAMTGTPVENSLVDAWSLTDLVFEGYLDTLKSFKERYVSPNIVETLSNNLNELELNLQQITLRRMKVDVLKQLPVKQDIHIPIMMNTEEKNRYFDTISEIKNDIESGGSCILALINKLQQFTAHPAQLDSSIKTDYLSLCQHSSKFELLMMYIGKIHASGEKVLIFATFQKTIDLIASALDEKYKILAGKIDGRTPNENRQNLIDSFTNKEGFDVLILHPRTAGMGLNITAATHVIHYCRQWNPALEEQATARAWRNGQQNIVCAYYFYFADTIEEDIDERLRLKRELSDRVVTVSSDKETDKELMMDYLENLSEQ